MVRPSVPAASPHDGSFRVDRQQAPEAIRDLESALAELEDIKRVAERLGRIDAMSHDSVSIDAARAIGLAATGGPWSLVPALDAGILQLRSLIAAMHQDLDAYEAADGDATKSLRHTGDA